MRFGPPMSPPLRPRATAAGFLLGSFAAASLTRSMTSSAICFSSRSFRGLVFLGLLDRFGIGPDDASAVTGARALGHRRRRVDTDPAGQDRGGLELAPSTGPLLYDHRMGFALQSRIRSRLLDPTSPQSEHQLVDMGILHARRGTPELLERRLLERGDNG